MSDDAQLIDATSRVDRLYRWWLDSWALPLVLVSITTALTWYLVMFQENYGLAIIANTVAMWGLWIAAINFPRKSRRGVSK